MAIDSLVRHARQLGDVYRETSQIFQATPTGLSQSVTFVRADPIHVATILTGFTDGTGSVTVFGLDALGAAQQHVFTFTGNHRLIDTLKEWTSVTAVLASAGLTNEATVGRVTLEATDANGQPEEVLQFVTRIRCKVSRTRLGQVVEASGVAPINSGTIFMYPGNGVRNSDRIVVDNVRWEVKAIRRMYNQRAERAFDQAIVFAEDQA